MPTIKWNRDVWNETYGWDRDGDEWDDQAEFCGQPYEQWKQSLITHFIIPNIPHDAVGLEIAPGHGRWTEHLASMLRELIIVDLSPSCIEFCKRRFVHHNNIRYYVNDGTHLDCVETDSINFVWSYDSFVHMDPDTINSYLCELSRVMRFNSSKAVIHHADRRHTTLRLCGPLRRFGKTGSRFYRIISIGKRSDGDGARSNVSRKMVATMARAAGLNVDSQHSSWGPGNKFNIRLFHDCISILTK
jgi:hypothetical protein